MQDLKFKTAEHGKPELDCSMLPNRARHIDFNLTGTNGMLGCAVAAGIRIGVDCERWDRRMKYPPERVAKRFMSQAEREQLTGTRLRSLRQTCPALGAC